ncbi:MAG TPA: plasma-membrane proton-efflux P-type ATPase [Candidatus Binataceae bacterium]|nr:plasma-membrane proton-efflux P-type ATPase [Candidatus Binataceae bacterium]
MVAEKPPTPNPAGPSAAAMAPAGLSSAEASRRLSEFGPNAVAAKKPHVLRDLVGKFWAPVPWMLEATIVLELTLGKALEAAVIGVLLIFNASLSFFQEARARGALELLQKRLSVRARVRRDGDWRGIAAEQLVPGDFIHLQMGDLVPADTVIQEGELALDQSALTGESLPVEVAPGMTAYAGSLVKRGEASGEVSATGARTYFGKTAELVRSAETVSHLQSVIFSIVKYLVAMDAILAAAVFAYAVVTALPLAETLPFVLILLVASVPVALPATFTLATALGALELAQSGVLVTRLSAIEEAAAMDVLCSDKTGTITQNQLSLSVVHPYPPFSAREVLRFAAYASDEASQDPIDLAVLARAAAEGLSAAAAQRISFIPFDPLTKLAEATVVVDGKKVRALKGAPPAVGARSDGATETDDDVERLARDGYRVLAVAGGEGASRLMGLLAFADPPRADSGSVVKRLNQLGVRVAMVTGDGLATARAVAAQVGITGRACSSRELRANLTDTLDCAIFAGVFPEDKFELVRALQHAGHVVGMTGDGVNDAPSLKQAEVGIAVATATDVAKASASLVLTEAGLTGILAAVETSRRIYQRMLTYTLNKVIKTVEIGLFLSLGVILARAFIITPLLIVLLLFTNDFVTMSLATDHVTPSAAPDRWHIRPLMLAGMSLGGLILILSFSLFFYGREFMRWSLPQLQTLVFITLVFSGQGMVYLVRERRHFWSSAPSGWMILSSLVDVAVVFAMAAHGIWMAPLPLDGLTLVLSASALYLIALDFVKVPILSRLQ